MDKTKHDPEVTHGGGVVPPIPHTEAWYATFGGKCPVCGVLAVVK